jgi:hypothetical protein
MMVGGESFCAPHARCQKISAACFQSPIQCAQISAIALTYAVTNLAEVCRSYQKTFKLNRYKTMLLPRQHAACNDSTIRQLLTLQAISGRACWAGRAGGSSNSWNLLSSWNFPLLRCCTCSKKGQHSTQSMMLSIILASTSHSTEMCEKVRCHACPGLWDVVGRSPVWHSTKSWQGLETDSTDRSTVLPCKLATANPGQSQKTPDRTFQTLNQTQSPTPHSPLATADPGDFYQTPHRSLATADSGHQQNPITARLDLHTLGTVSNGMNNTTHPIGNYT